MSRRLLEACDYYASRKKQRITFEYILIAGVNDADEQAHHAGRARAAVVGQGESYSL